MDSVLRPRDIQARIRAGETPEDVAAAAQTTVDRIMGFATPVLAERAYQAQLAQRASVRRRAAAGQVGNLGSAVTAHLEALEVDPESVEWDAWRREDGRWTVVAGYVARGEHHQAAFAYDAAGRFVVAEDDEARTLVGERSTPAPEEPPTVDEPPVGAALDDLLIGRDQLGDRPGDRPVDESVEQSVGQRRERTGEQLPLGDDAITLVTGRAPRPPVEDEVTFDLTEASTAVRAAGPRSTADADWISTQASERPEAPAAPVPPAPSPQEVPDATEVEGDAREEEKEEAMTLFEVPAPHAAPQADTEPDVQPQAQPETDAAAAEAEEPAPRPARTSRSRGRASVPSWDEIMFGTPKSE